MVGHTRDIIGSGGQAETGKKCKIFRVVDRRKRLRRPVQHGGKSCMIEFSNMPTQYLSEIPIKDKTGSFKSRKTKRNRPGITRDGRKVRLGRKKGAKPLDGSAIERKKIFFSILLYYFALSF